MTEDETLLSKLRRWQKLNSSALIDVRVALGFTPKNDRRLSSVEMRLREADVKLQKMLEEIDQLVPVGSR